MYQKSSMKQFCVQLWKLNWFMVFKLVPDTSYTSSGIIYCSWFIALFSPSFLRKLFICCICETPSLAFAFHWSSAWLESPWMLLCLNLNWFSPGTLELFLAWLRFGTRECVILCIVTFKARVAWQRECVENGFWIHYHLRLGNYKTEVVPC